MKKINPPRSKAPQRKGAKAAKSKQNDWTLAFIEGLFELLRSFPIPARINLTADLFLVFLLVVGGKYYQPIPPYLNGIALLMGIVFIGGCSSTVFTAIP